MKITFKVFTTLFALFSISWVVSSCSKSTTDESSSGKYLYVASGACYSGAGITTYTGLTSSRKISKVSLSTGEITDFLDFASPFQGGDFAPETTPQALVDDGTNILVLTENATNTGDRRIFKVPKSSPYNASVYSNDALALNGVNRAMVKESDGTILFSKSTAIEKIGTNTLRIPMGANPWINAPAGNCATSTTLISNMVSLPPYSPATNGKILFSHNTAVTANNRIAMVSHNGYNAGADCIAGVQVAGVAHNYAANVTGPTPINFPATQGVNVTAMVYISTGTGTGKLIAGYSSALATELNNSTNQNYVITMWDVAESSTTAATITNPVILYRDFSIIFGISAMAYDSTTGHLYVATASQPGVATQTTYPYKVEKFLLDINTPSLTLVQTNSKPFINRSSATNCISSMIIAD